MGRPIINKSYPSEAHFFHVFNDRNFEACFLQLLQNFSGTVKVSVILIFFTLISCLYHSLKDMSIWNRRKTERHNWTSVALLVRVIIDLDICSEKNEG